MGTIQECEKKNQDSIDGKRVRELDGIRGFAILLVLVWHYVQNATPVMPGSWLAYCFIPLRLTWTGVDLFFVLSGFLIGGILMQTRKHANYYVAFYGRRAFRILPLYVSWLLMYIYWSRDSSGIYEPLRTSLFSSALPTWSYLCFLQNVFMTMSESFGAEFLGITWSLAVEEQFYLFMPILIKRANRPMLWLSILFLLAPAIRMLFFLNGNRYFGPYTMLLSRIDALSLGVAVAAVLRDEIVSTWLRKRLRMIGFFGIVLSSGFIVLTLIPRHGLLMNSIGYTWIALCYATWLLWVMIQGGSSDNVLAQFLRMPALVSLGSISYMVYLCHQAINNAVHAYLFGTKPVLHDLPSIIATIFSLWVVLLLAVTSNSIVEVPLMKFARRRLSYN